MGAKKVKSEKLRNRILRGYLGIALFTMIPLSLSGWQAISLKHQLRKLQAWQELYQKFVQVDHSFDTYLRQTAIATTLNNVRVVNPNLASEVRALLASTQNQVSQLDNKNIQTAFKTYHGVAHQVLAQYQQMELLLRQGNFRDVSGYYLSSAHNQLLSRFTEVEMQMVNLAKADIEAAQSDLQLRAYVLSMSLFATFVLVGFAIVITGVSTSTYISEDIGQKIGDITNQITLAIEEQEKLLSQQAASVNETTTTMDELGASSLQSAEQAIASSTNAEQAIEVSKKGRTAVDRTIEGIETLRRTVADIAEKIMQLSKQASQISTVSDLVAGIASTTNILALNAAVEANRAGEQGRGFSVVATEIRKLADQSKKSADQISLLIKDIETAISSTVMVTDQGMKTAQECISLGEATANAFQEINEMIELISMNVQQIVLGSKQQAVGVKQCVDAMTSINAEAQESSANISQIRSSIEQLSATIEAIKGDT